MIGVFLHGSMASSANVVLIGVFLHGSMASYANVVLLYSNRTAAQRHLRSRKPLIPLGNGTRRT